MMEFTNLTRKVEIGANSYLLRLGDKNLIIDSGLHPKEEGSSATPNFDLLTDREVEAIFITHAHQDHVGSLPLLTRSFQDVPVFMTEGTYRIAEIMLHNAVNVMTRQKEEHDIQGYPLFTHRGVDFSRQAWRQLPFRKRYGLDGERDDREQVPTFEWFQAGHILGSASLLIRDAGKSILFTGDVNLDPQTLLLPGELPAEGVDVLVMECTRGDSPTPEGLTRASEEARFRKAILDAFSQGGSIMVPVFALGKTQEMLGILWKMQQDGELIDTPIYIGGLSTKITDVYDAMSGVTHRQHPGLKLMDAVSPYVLNGQDIGITNPRKHAIYALSSGMMTEHTLSNIFARKLVEDPNMHLFFVGYSDPESPAGKLRRTAPGGQIVLDAELPPQTLRCQVQEFNFSAHATRESLCHYATRLNPSKILLVHGDQPAVAWMQSTLQQALPKTEVIVPQPGKTLHL